MGKVYYRNARKLAIIELFRYFFILLSIISFTIYLFAKNYNILYLSVLSILIQNILYGASNTKKRLLFLFFQITFFIFLMTKPIIAIFRQEKWWNTIYSDFSANADIQKMLFCMLLSLVAIWIGAILGENIKSKRVYWIPQNNYDELLKNNMRYIALIVFAFSSTFTLMQGFEKIAFIKNHSYLEYYTSFHTQMPYLFRLIATFSQYSICFYLATLPTKKQAFLPCCLYIGLAVPTLIMGSRADICLNILLIFFYYLLRDSWGDSKKWLGKLEKLLIVIISPIALVFLGVYIDIRAHRAINLSSIPSAIINFLNDQGITFPYMCAGMGNIAKLPGDSQYTFGPIIDYLKYGSLGRIFYGIQPLGDSNSILRACEGNSYAHHMSYVLLGNDYLDGRGIGSSYINEVFTDFGYAGIFLFSLLIGFLLIYFVMIAKRSCWGCSILLLSFTGMIYIPRAESTNFIAYLLRLQFWFIVIICYFSVYLFGRKYIYKYVDQSST